MNEADYAYSWTPPRQRFVLQREVMQIHTEVAPEGNKLTVTQIVGGAAYLAWVRSL